MKVCNAVSKEFNVHSLRFIKDSSSESTKGLGNTYLNANCSAL